MPVVNGAGLVGKVVLVTGDRSTVQLITDPDFAVGIRLLSTQHHRAPRAARAAARTCSSTPTSSPTPRTSRSRHVGDHQRHRPRRLPRPRSRSARSARSTSRAAASRSTSSSGPWPTPRASPSSPSCSGSPRVIPPSPLIVAFRTSLVLVARPHLPARHRARASSCSACRATCCCSSRSRRHRGRARTGARPSASPPASPTTCSSRRPSACPRSPTRSWPTSSAASRTRCSAPRGGSRCVTATAASMVGVILYGVFGTVLGEDLIGLDLRADRGRRRPPEHHRGAARGPGDALGHRRRRRACGPGRCTDDRRVAPGADVGARHRRVRAVRRAVRRASTTCRSWPPTSTRSRRRPTGSGSCPSRRPAGGSSIATASVLVDNRISVQVTIDRTVLDELDDDERTRVLTAVADGLARSGTPKTVEQLEEDLGQPALQPLRARAGRRQRARGPQDLDRRARRRAARAWPRSGWPCATTPTGSWPPTCSGTPARSTTTSSRSEADSRQAVHAQRRDREVRRRGGVRGRPAGHARVARRSRSTPRTSRSATSVDEEPPIPGDDIVLNLDIDVQAQAEQALQSGPGDRQGSAVHAAATSRRRPRSAPPSCSTRRPAASSRWRRIPTFNPAEFVDGISDAEWELLTAEENNAPLNNWAIQGQYAPGSTFKPFSAVSAPRGGPDHARHHRLRRRRVRGARLHGRLVRLQQRQGEAVRRGRPASLAHRVVRLLLLRPRRPVLDRAGRASAARSVTPTCSSSGASTPTPGSTCRASSRAGSRRRAGWPTTASQIGCADGADSWRTGNNVNMAIGQGDVLLTPLQIASGYATIGNGGTVWQPHVVKEVRDGVTKELKRTIEPKAARHRSSCTPEWRQALYDGLTGVTTQTGGTAVGAFSGFPTDTFPVAAKTGTAQVARQGPDRRVRRLRAGQRPAVRHLGAARGVRLRRLGGGAGRPPALRRAARPGAAHRRRPRAVASSSSTRCRPTSARTCATDGRPHHLLGPQPGRPRRPRAPVPQPGRRRGATSTSCWSAASSPCGALGCLMIFSATRGRDPSDFDTSFLFKQVLFVGIGVGDHARASR